MSADMVFRYDRFGRGGDHTAFNQEGYPAVRIGLIEPYPSFSPDAFASMLQLMGSRGIAPAFVHVDVDLAAVQPGRDNLVGDLRRIQQMCAAQKIAFGVIVSGTNGRVEVRVNGQQLNLTTEAGKQANANNLRTGSGVGYLKLDTTYNIYSYPTSLGITMNAWYDAVALSTSGWIGAVGGTPPPPIPAPAAPTNVRVIR